MSRSRWRMNRATCGVVSCLARRTRACYPPEEWQPREGVRWDFDANANPQVPPGGYKVVLRVYEGAEGQALDQVGGEDWMIIERVFLR